MSISHSGRLLRCEHMGRCNETIIRNQKGGMM
jgi:hypothetical protein